MSTLFVSFLLLFLILVSSHLVHTAFSGKPLSYKCGKKIENNATFLKNRDAVLEDLRRNTPESGFSHASSQQSGNVSIFGISLCRGDIKRAECRTCLSDATDHIEGDCSESSEAVIWYDFCSLKYSDQDFIGTLDTQYNVSVLNEINVDYSNVDEFRRQTEELLGNLREKGRHFAKNETKLSNTTTIYGMTQCTADILSVDCQQCLKDSAAALPQVEIDGTSLPKGARVLTPNCMVRYDTDNFFLNNTIYDPPTN